MKISNGRTFHTDNGGFDLSFMPAGVGTSQWVGAVLGKICTVADLRRVLESHVSAHFLMSRVVSLPTGCEFKITAYTRDGKHFAGTFYVNEMRAKK